ncbi:hypothetical protein DERP_009189 [Dermatophagoides pteronyssinus]|uniref:Variable surface protein n=1 Tax=Dermatophagoides pteronyssinus TaxID=6956 RepID=A0ABQ8JQT9_DERPT|nr:hypothetical protein DERP_009189 [Dermatophagoides pteronyssinus]
MIIVIIITVNNVRMANSDNSFILHGRQNNQTGWDIVQYPYKSVYGLPKALKCVESIRDRFYECEKSFHRKWEIAVDEYFYETKKFCCFVLETMNCESDAAKNCNEEYSKKIESNTLDTFKKVCDQVIGSNYRWHCWWTEERKVWAGIISGVILLFVAAYCVFVGLKIHKHIPKKQTGWDYIRYPYKSVYGLPNSLYCDESTRNKFNECEISFHRKWEIAVDHYFYETKKFCCFILETMNCELDVAKKCNEQYSKKLESNTRDTFKKVCDKIVGSNYGWHCWWTEKRIINAWIITGVILLVITVACVAGLIINKHIKNKKMEAVDKAMDNARLKTPTTTPLKRRRVPPKTTYVDKDLIKEYHKILSKQMKRKFLLKMSRSSETESEIISLPKYIFNLFVSTINDLIEIKSQYDIWGGYFKESDENSKWYLKRFPYKPIYGIPDSLDCDQSIRQRFNECEILSHKEWDISINEYFYITRRFCCFVWDSMHCEYNIAAKCDEEYAKKLRNITFESFEKACDTISATDGIYVLTFIIMFIVISYRINDACNYAKKYGK